MRSNQPYRGKIEMNYPFASRLPEANTELAGYHHREMVVLTGFLINDDLAAIAINMHETADLRIID